jgi:hypothetical protein
VGTEAAAVEAGESEDELALGLSTTAATVDAASVFTPTVAVEGSLDAPLSVPPPPKGKPRRESSPTKPVVVIRTSSASARRMSQKDENDVAAMEVDDKEEEEEEVVVAPEESPVTKKKVTKVRNRRRQVSVVSSDVQTTTATPTPTHPPTGPLGEEDLDLPPTRATDAADYASAQPKGAAELTVSSTAPIADEQLPRDEDKTSTMMAAEEEKKEEEDKVSPEPYSLT